MYFALYLKMKNADFTGGLWWTVTYCMCFSKSVCYVLSKICQYDQKNTFYPILQVFAPQNNVRTYIAWSWKTTLITWFFFYKDDIQLKVKVPPSPGDFPMFSDVYLKSLLQPIIGHCIMQVACLEEYSVILTTYFYGRNQKM